MNRLRIVVNSGLEMLMGANVVMLSRMKMSLGLDQEALNHGRSMMEQGKKSIQQDLSGFETKATPQGGGGNTPVMEFTRDLAAALLKVADTLEKTNPGEMNPDTTTMHYFNLLINQAMEMALEGSDLIMLGRMETTQDIDVRSVEQGRAMLSDARSVIIEVMGSRAMSEMHSREAGKMPEMGSTHKLASGVLEVLDLLDSLPGGD